MGEFKITIKPIIKKLSLAQGIESGAADEQKDGDCGKYQFFHGWWLVFQETYIHKWSQIIHK